MLHPFRGPSLCEKKLDFVLLKTSQRYNCKPMQQENPYRASPSNAYHLCIRVQKNQVSIDYHCKINLPTRRHTYACTSLGLQLSLFLLATNPVCPQTIPCVL